MAGHVLFAWVGVRVRRDVGILEAGDHKVGRRGLVRHLAGETELPAGQLQVGLVDVRVGVCLGDLLPECGEVSAPLRDQLHEAVNGLGGCLVDFHEREVALTGRVVLREDALEVALGTKAASTRTQVESVELPLVRSVEAQPPGRHDRAVAPGAEGGERHGLVHDLVFGLLVGAQFGKLVFLHGFVRDGMPVLRGKGEAAQKDGFVDRGLRETWDLERLPVRGEAPAVHQLVGLREARQDALVEADRLPARVAARGEDLGIDAGVGVHARHVERAATAWLFTIVVSLPSWRAVVPELGDPGRVPTARVPELQEQPVLAD